MQLLAFLEPSSGSDAPTAVSFVWPCLHQVASPSHSTMVEAGRCPAALILLVLIGTQQAAIVQDNISMFALIKEFTAHLTTVQLGLRYCRVLMIIVALHRTPQVNTWPLWPMAALAVSRYPRIMGRAGRVASVYLMVTRWPVILQEEPWRLDATRAISTSRTITANHLVW